MSENERQFEDQPDIGLAAVMDRIDNLANEVHRLNDNLGLLVAEIRNNNTQAEDDREIISQALAITKEDSDFYHVQAGRGLQRISDKIGALLALFMQVGTARGVDADSSEELIIEPRRPRVLPMIVREKRKTG